MLELRPTCEHCDRPLPNTSTKAMICTFECTFCKDCVGNLLHNVCPNCGGGFVPRPVRPSKYKNKYPASTKRVYKPVDLDKFQTLLDEHKNIPAHKR